MKWSRHFFLVSCPPDLFWKSTHPFSVTSLHIYIYIYIYIHTYIHTYTHTYIHTYIFVVVNFDALAQASDFRIERRQVVFLCWEQDSNPGPQTPIRQQTECSLTNRLSYRGSSLKNLNSTARPYDQQAFSPLGPTVSWLSHLALAIYIFVVVNFDALAQASDFRIERRQVVFLCWEQDSNPGPQTPIRQQTECSLTNRLSYRGSSLKNLNSTARPYDQQAFSPLGPTVSWLSHLALAIYIFVVVNFDALAQASDFRIERRQVVFLCWEQDSNPGPQTPIRQQTECSLTNRLSYRGSSLKNLNSTARPYDQQAFSPLGPTVSWLSHLALAIYIFVVVNFDALAQASDFRIERRQVVFLCWEQDSNPGPQTPIRQQTECSLTNRLSYRGSSLKNLNSTARPYDQQAFSPLGPTVSWLSHLALAIYIFVVVNFDALAQASDFRIERRQVVFLCWEQDSNPGPQTPIRQQTECSLTNRLSYRGSSLKNLNSTARPYDQQAFSPLGPTVSWLSHLALAIYIFVVVNFDALAQASDFRIERRQVVFLCWEQDSNPGPQTPIRQQTECSLTNRLSYRGSSLKNLNSTARPYDQQAFSPLGPTVSWLSHLALAIYIFVVVNFDALAQASDFRIERRQVVFLCWEQDSNPGPQTPIRQQTECSLTNRLSYRGSSLKNLNSTARPYDQQAFSPLGPTVSWLSHLALAIYIFVVVNFDALAQASDFRIERRQVVFLCWEQDSNPGPQTPIRQQTECSLTNRLSYRGSSLKNLNSTARPYDQQAFSPLGPTVSWLSHLALAIYIFVVVNFDALAQASDFRIERRQVVFLCWEQDSNPGPQTPIRQQTECSLTNRLSYRGSSLKNLNSTARPYDQQAFSPLGPTVSWLSHLALAIYIFVVVNFDALAQASDFRIERRQVVFLCWEQDSNPGPQTPIRQQTECSLTNRLSYRGSSLKTWTRQPVPMISKHSAHLAPLSVDFRTWLWRYTYLLLLILMLWHRQAIFESKGDKLSSSAESRIRTRDPRHLFASRLNARWQTDWAIEDQA